MPTTVLRDLPPGFYRPGSRFSAAELQVMGHEGAVRPLLGDLYVCSAVPDAPGSRALGCQTLLSAGLRAHAVLCGESAAWVHLGAGRAPVRITVITAGVYRRRTAGPLPWQVHQVPLGTDEQSQLQGVPVTTPLRTAADLFLGIGTVENRRALDAAPVATARRADPTAGSTPGSPAGSAAGPSADPAAGPAAVRRDSSEERWAAIRRLCLANPEQLQRQAFLGQIQVQLEGRPGDATATPPRLQRIEALLSARVFGG
ncbi:hypothetical protein [Nesterenkonia sp. CF4.4]|uniref:hypothetical protein n=1 Tax=Nesterenkonia sp. CF4.4 TaxID=3373079 RepID=UPI003EE57425